MVNLVAGPLAGEITYDRSDEQKRTTTAAARSKQHCDRSGSNKSNPYQYRIH